MLLERAIKDIVNQTYTDWRIIVVNDGGNSDNIKSILSKYDVKQYQLLSTAQDKGLHKAINVGARAATAKYIVVHDDDDTWDKDFLKVTIKFLQDNPTAKGVVTQALKIQETLKGNKVTTKSKAVYNPTLRGVISYCDMLKNNLFPPISFVFCTEVFQEIGYFDESLEVLEDWEFYLRFLRHNDIYVIPQPLAHYHIRKQTKGMPAVFNNTITSKKDLHRMYDTIIRNRYLRNDLDNGEFGIGELMNLIKWSDSRVVRKVKVTTKNIGWRSQNNSNVKRMKRLIAKG